MEGREGGGGGLPHLRKGSSEQALGNWVEVNERAWEGGRSLHPAQCCPLARGRRSRSRGPGRTESLHVAA